MVAGTGRVKEEGHYLELAGLVSALAEKTVHNSPNHQGLTVGLCPHSCQSSHMTNSVSMLLCGCEDRLLDARCIGLKSSRAPWCFISERESCQTQSSLQKDGDNVPPRALLAAGHPLSPPAVSERECA